MKIAVICVTFNRKELLKKLLSEYENQSECISEIIIINNNSNDGTKEYLNEKYSQNTKFNIINLAENLGGSGGFYTGIVEALKKDFDWIYLADDDAFPEKKMFENFLEKVKKINKNDFSSICTSVINNGKIDLGHRKIYKKEFLNIKKSNVSNLNYREEYFYLNAFSFVGVFINAKKINSQILPEKNYFIWFDDTEYSLQLSKLGKIICIPELRVNHDIVESEIGTVSWKMYYGIRNKLLTYKKHYGNFYFLRYSLLSLIIYKIKSYLYYILRNTNKSITNKMKYEAIKDAILNRQGRHDIYKPGWKI